MSALPMANRRLSVLGALAVLSLGLILVGRPLLASAGVHLKPRIPAVRSAPKIPSSCSTVSFEIGLSLLTKTTMPFDLPSASKAPEATVIAVGA